MSDDAAQWAKIKAEYRLGASVAALAKKYGVKTYEILKRIGAERWARAGAEPTPNLPARPEDVVDEAVDEALSDVVREHREMTRELRELYQNRLAEYQAMLQHMLSFLDQDEIARLKREAEVRAGTGAADAYKDVTKYLTDSLKALQLTNTLLEQLQRINGGVIDRERLVWNLAAIEASDQKGQDDFWTQMLAKVREPSNVKQLPADVVDFENRLRNREQK